MRRNLWIRALVNDVEVLLTTDQAPGAMPNGTRIKKAIYERGDLHSVGARGTVIGSVGRVIDGSFGYFVEWDDRPGIPIFVSGRRIRPTCGS